LSSREVKPIRTRGEIEAAVRAFASAQWARLHYVAKIHAWRTGWTFEELLQEAILRTLAGDRNCPSDVDIIKHLSDSMSSIADGERKKAPNQSPHVPVVQPGAPVADAEDPPAPELSTEEELKGAADQEDIRREVLAIFDDDPVARDIVEGIMANYSADDLKELSGLQGKDYASKRRLIRRRLNKNFPNGRKA
jgi:hypothetical protein